MRKFPTRLGFLFSCLLLLGSLSPLYGQGVTFEKSGDDIVVSIDGEEFSRYHTGKNWPKPFFHPVLIDGVDITRPVDPNEKEHPHHKGIWVSVDEVNKIQFWAEKGKIVNVSAKWKNSLQNASNAGDCWSRGLARYRSLGFASPVSTQASYPPGVLAVVNHWMGEDGKPAVIEETEIQIHPNKLLVYAITFRSPGHDVEFEDTKEGLLGFRMAHTMRESEGGRVLGANGKKGTKENWGKHNKWIDYVGEVEGKTFGVTLMDHPENFRPSRYHVRNYGLFSISPFGEKAYTRGKQEAKPHHLKPGESFTLKYGIYFHTGDTQEGDVAETYEQFLSSK